VAASRQFGIAIALKLSAKTEYACLAMLELAGHHAAGTTVRAGDIAQRHGIPLQFLVQILRSLRSAGLIESVRGAGGGYRLSSAPHEVALSDILVAMEGRLEDRSAAPSSPCCEVLQSAVDAAEAAYRSVLQETSLAALADAARASGAAMYYI
jgi:Rrf2 family protein